MIPVGLVFAQHVRAGGRRADGLWLLGPAGLGAFALYLGLSQGEPFAFSVVQDFWYREFAGPLVGAWDGWWPPSTAPASSSPARATPSTSHAREATRSGWPASI